MAACTLSLQWIFSSTRFISYLTFGSAENNFAAAKTSLRANALHFTAYRRQNPSSPTQEKKTSRQVAVGQPIAPSFIIWGGVNGPEHLEAPATFFCSEISFHLSPARLLSPLPSAPAAGHSLRPSVANRIRGARERGGRNWIVVYADALPLNYSRRLISILQPATSQNYN